MARTEVPITDVREAVRKYVSLPGDGGMFELFYGTLRQVGDLAGLDRSLGDNTSWERRRDWNKFCSQVKRAFDGLAAEGTLRKAGGGTDGPDGLTLRRNEVRYYTPVAWEAAEHEAADRQEARQAEAARWAAISARLEALKMKAERSRNGSGALSMDPGTWEDLLSLAEQGQQVQDELSAPSGRRRA